MTEQPKPIADIAREAMQRTFLDLTGQSLAAAHAEALVESAFEAIRDAAARHLSCHDSAEARR